jgi:DNA repair exonuclease SbcCD nuclease subunit
MWGSVGFIHTLQHRFSNRSGKFGGIPVLNTGDTFDKAKPSLYLVKECLEYFPNQGFITIPGQHDLPNHSLNLLDKSGIKLLSKIRDGALLLTLENSIIETGYWIYGFPFGSSNFQHPEDRETTDRPKIALIHTLVTETESAAKLMGGISAKALMDKMTGYDLIVSGDNHKPFTYEQGGRLLVNPGSMMRMSADQIDHKPRVYLWYAKDNHVEPVYLPIEQGVISREHIEKKEDRDKKIEAFVTHLNEDYKTGVDFEGNLKEYFRKHRTKRAVETMTWEVVG